MSEKEYGFPICQGKGSITSGKRVVGEAHSVSIPLACPAGRVIGVHHKHPGGSLELSEQDKRTARQKRLEYVCIKGKGRVKCYRFKR